VATQARAAQRKTRWSTPPPRPSSGTHPQPYRRRRPETSTLHRIVREQLETYLALANEANPMGDGVPDHVEKEFSAVLHILLRALHATLREACPTAPATGASRSSQWAALLARIYEVSPLICPTCGTALTFIAFLTEPEPVPDDHFDQT
jgi:hypothetical protein